MNADVETRRGAIGEVDQLLNSQSIGAQSKGRSMDARFGRICFALSGLLLVGAGAMAGERSRQNASPLFGVSLPTGYRDWKVISVAHEAGSLNDIRVILGNGIAMRAYRSGRRPFPDGTAIVRIAWKLTSSARNDKIFGRAQSFVAGEPTNVQIEFKDARKYAATGGWGYGQFESGKANPDVALMQTCFACHTKLPAKDDSIFTSYAR